VIGHEVEPGFMLDVLKSARRRWRLMAAGHRALRGRRRSRRNCSRAAFSTAAGRRSFLQVPGAIVLSSLVWTAMHMQYEWYFFGEVFCLGLWFGYLRYRSGSIWLTIVLQRPQQFRRDGAGHLSFREGLVSFLGLVFWLVGLRHQRDPRPAWSARRRWSAA